MGGRLVSYPMVTVLDGDLGKFLVDLRRDAASKFLSVDEGDKR